MVSSTTPLYMFMLRWLFRGIIWPSVLVWVQALASVPCAIDNTLGIMLCQCQWHHITKKSCCISVWLPLPKKWKGATDDTIDIMWCQYWHQCFHMTRKSHVAPNFNCHDLRNAVVPLMILSEWCDFSNNGVTWPIKSCLGSSQLSWPKKCSCAICDILGIMWFQWHHMTKVILHLILVGLMSGMQWCHGWHLASHDAHADTNGISWTKRPAAPHFSCLDLRNAVVLLRMPLVSFDSNGNIWPTE